MCTLYVAHHTHFFLDFLPVVVQGTVMIVTGEFGVKSDISCDLSLTYNPQPRVTERLPT